ncbi:MAG: lipopolysaccharide assembly protein LapB [Gammaproteobacteria bacterium]|nr:lipopolysaccharide assembly protein LapB [Gammaproteobacteria bacterium]
MPAESTFLLAGLLFVAAALGYVFARFGETDDEDETPEQFSSDYLKGLNYVLNEEPDRAVELFTRMAELDDDALETHFALGSLFRKRGEVDRAIRVHQNLMARPSLGQTHKDQAEDALAEDYLSAGLFDRAESLFIKLSESEGYRVKALQRLVRIYEVTREWDRAIEIKAELDRAQKGSGHKSAGSQLAHYYCELAEQAREEQDIVQTRAMLKQADNCRETTVRSQLARADLASDTGKHKEAVRLYQKVIKQAPHLLVDVVRRLARSYRELDDQRGFSAYLQKLVDSDEQHVAAIAMATVQDSAIDDPVALAALIRFISADATLSQLVGIERFENASAEERTQYLADIRQALRTILASKPAYHCTECGYGCLGLQWQCPGCRAWETVKPEVRIRLA